MDGKLTAVFWTLAERRRRQSLGEDAMPAGIFSV
jgi:hypothetical protein